VFRSKALRPIGGVVLVTFTALTLQPLTAAAQLPSASSRAQASSDSGEERFSRTLNDIHEILKEVVPQAAMPHMFRSTAPTAPGKAGEKVLQAVGPKMHLESERAKPLPGVDVVAKVKQLRGKYKELKNLEAEVNKGFNATEKHIRDKNLPAEIFARHEAAVADYERRKAEFTVLMQAVETTADASAGSTQAGSLQGALASLGDFMAKYPNAKTHTPTDPKNLPWGSPKPVTRAPYTSSVQFKTSRLFGEPVKVAQTGSLSGISLPTTVLPNTPTPADTAPTEDVQITQAIRDLAASLGNKPVPIYNWVRNNIQFIPSYGSIQGSDMTLQTKRGNSFDTASLLIALLRAANVPARYVYGTIEVPVDRAMNWVGGVTMPQAAISLMNQGGIPSIGIGLGGQVRSIRLEHVWAQAFVDYNPSRGAVNRNPSTWVPLDASFKQYQFTQGMDIKTNVPFDAQSFITQIQQGATVNEAEGWVQNVNQTQIQQALANYQTQATNYVNAQKPNATLGDVLGTQSIAQENRPILLGTLPYRSIATGATFQAIPDNLRWKFRYNVYGNDTDRAFDKPFIALEHSTPTLAGKKITLSFRPASPADEATINSFLPPPHTDGTPIQPSELPQSLPGYLIRLIPEVQIEGQIAAIGPALTMGSELIQNAALFDPARGWSYGGDNRPTAGEFVATTVAGGSPSAQLLGYYQQRILLERDRIQSGDMQGISASDLLGDSLFAAALSYFSMVGKQSGLLGASTGIVSSDAVSFGNVSVVNNTAFSFGVVRSVSPAGFQYDIDFLSQLAVSKINNSDATRAYLRELGHISSGLEHLVPEMLFGGPDNPSEGVSAVKALLRASQEGQRIYRFDTNSDVSVVSSLNISSDVKNEILNALAARKEVSVSGGNVSVSGWTGVGYIIVDTETGAGAYKISGGSNGSFLKDLRKAIYILATMVALTNWFLDIRVAPLGPWFIFAQFAVGLAITVQACSNIDASVTADLILAQMTAAIVTAILLLIMVAAFGPVAALLIGQISFYLMDILFTNARASRGCRS